MSDSEFIAKILNKSDISHVSKGELERAVMKQFKAIELLLVELYCENPGHGYFKSIGIPESVLRLMEMERLKRVKGIGRIFHRILSYFRGFFNGIKGGSDGSKR